MKEITNYQDNLFKASAKLNFYNFSELFLNTIDANSIEVTSSSINVGEFLAVNFYSSSFLSTKFIKVKFDCCNMKGSDISSVWMNDCVFYKTEFDDSTITDSVFINCTFELSSLNNIVLSNSQFINCTFKQMPIDNSTVTLNKYIKCKIQNTHFTESFYYQIFEDCLFENIELNPVLLGYNYGFSQELISQIARKNNLASVEELFINDYFLINAAILRLNQTGAYHDLAILACVTAMCQMIRQDILVKNDEIQFLKRMTEYLSQKKLISQFIKMRMWQCLTSLIDTSKKNIAMEQSLSYIQEFSNTLYFDFQNFQQELQNILNKLNTADNNANKLREVEIVYSIAPAFQLLQLMEQMRTSYCPNAEEVKLVYSKQGSFVEKLEMANSLVSYLQTFLALLGCIVPFAVYGLEKKDRRKSSGPSSSNGDKNTIKSTENKDSRLYIPKSQMIVPHMTYVDPSTSRLISDVTNIIINNSISNNSEFYGYNYKNIKSITITYVD